MLKRINPSHIVIAASLFLFSSCKKLLEVAPPIDSLTTTEIFSTNKQAEWAIASIYSKMINGGENYIQIADIAERSFSAGLSTIMGGLSADEMIPATIDAGSSTAAFQNKLTLVNSASSDILWATAYKVVYDATAAIEGLEASTSTLLADSVKKQLLGEALVLRAFSYFYLVNFFGDVPLVLSSDYVKNGAMQRTPVAQVYEQMKTDLIRAKPLLNQDFSVGKNERVRVNRWVAEALLARVYLYTGEHQLAAGSASELINRPAQFYIEPDLNNVFKANSSEAIFQLKPTTEVPNFAGTTPEALKTYHIWTTGDIIQPEYRISQQLMNAFEATDKRKLHWTTDASGVYSSNKYKHNEGITSYTVMRLAEMYLIRAEARLLGNAAAKNDAIDDLNVLRERAGLGKLDYQLNSDQVKAAIEQERRVELFFEWGHRWFDLKRTGKAATVLPAISYKQPWWGNYQLLYPVPSEEIKLNSKLLQNPEYDAR
ncbi:RagB/SusD family nutrient uptake outer membrane protein [Pseudoflavitalea rhizosphaerae]|uniref:RagB/SusD family nutrient uptake outer membrane protein n=1 Tax=Pseudoflavitalea rhizosphaerae TaxID=1884793 RepID=UPI0013E02D06|nr:RagB/SusD family nutrient uptake outer membrane protein [Pseudoflavitalea rhizosphaerae]